MKKVLLIATTRLTMDGLTEILLRVARIAAREYLVGFALGEGCSADIQPQLEAIGSVYQLPSRKKKLPCYMAALAALVKEKGYEVVHIHGNSATMAFDLLAVWAGGATVRITHCHNCAHQPALKQATLGRLLNRLVTDPVACSRAAGEMLYTRPFRVLVNGIDCERFSFSPSVREPNAGEIGAAGLLCGWPHWPFQPAKKSYPAFPHLQNSLAAKATGKASALRPRREFRTISAGSQGAWHCEDGAVLR